MDPAELYRYRARYLSNYDGDTIDVNIDLGLGVWKMKERLRLFGINTPELRGGSEESRELGRAAKNFVSRMLASAEDILVETVKDKSGKYGRLLACVYYLPPGESQYRCLNDDLVVEGLAELREY